MSTRREGRLIAIASILSLGSLMPADAQESKEYLVTVHAKPVIEKETGKELKLAPALLAMKDASGTLKGCDELGTPIIEIPVDQVEKLKSSPAVKSISTDVPAKQEGVARIKISYKENEKLSDDDLKQLGLKRVEDAKKGSYLIAEPLNKRIDHKLAEKLDKCDKITYVTPNFRVKAAPPAPNPPGPK